MSASAKAYIVTGPTSGIGRAVALELAKDGTVVLVARNPQKLGELQNAIQQSGHNAVSVVCDLSDMTSVRRAAAEIAAYNLPIAALVNNAGIRQARPTKSAQGWDMTFATNHLGPFALTEALAPHLPDGAQVLFVASAVENPERQPAKTFGFRGGRYLSAEACARGEWAPGGAEPAGFDAYATSKQAILAAAMALAREAPRLRINAVEPGVIPITGLDRSGSPVAHALMNALVPLLAPFIKVLSTPRRAGRMIAKIVADRSARTGVYYDESGHPMQASPLARDPQFQDRVVAETRALLTKANA